MLHTTALAVTYILAFNVALGRGFEMVPNETRHAIPVILCPDKGGVVHAAGRQL